MAATNLQARVYPIADESLDVVDVSIRDVGVCFSGGGSRSLSAVMGQLRGLREMGWLDRVGTISAVSGGCWASSLFLFLPSAISYDDFLGQGVAPNELIWAGDDVSPSVSYLPKNNLGWVPTRLGWEAIFKVYESLKKAGFSDWRQLWRVVIGELVFQDFGLYQPDANQNPTHYFGWTEDYFKQNIEPLNPNLSVSNFHFARNMWPYLIMNGSMFYPKGVNSLVPVVSSFLHSGIRGMFDQDQEPVGGGLVDSFALGSSFLSRSTVSNLVDVQQPRPFSVVDMASMSSAAFAEALWHKLGLDKLELEYTYWPVSQDQPGNQTYQFADGGLLENTGLMGLLATTRLKKVVVFVNGNEKVEHVWETSEYTQIPSDIPPLFGYQPLHGILDHDGYRLYMGDDNPNSPLQKHNQVFPPERFQEVLDGLKNAADNFENTAMFLQQGLEVQENAWFGIGADQTRTVDVLWVCNNRVNAWEKQITDATILSSLADRLLPDSHLWNFPYYSTLDQLNLTAPQVNMLAQLSWWNVTADQNLAVWKQFFG